MFQQMMMSPEEERAPSKPKEDHGGVLDTREAAAYLKVRENTLVVWRHRGEGPRCVRKGQKFVRYRKQDLDEWLAANLSD